MILPNDIQMDSRKGSMEKEIVEIVNRETEAWNNKDEDKPLTIFHRDMVWSWTGGLDFHDSMDWIFGVGQSDYQRWKEVYCQLSGT